MHSHLLTASKFLHMFRPKVLKAEVFRVGQNKKSQSTTKCLVGISTQGFNNYSEPTFIMQR